MVNVETANFCSPLVLLHPIGVGRPLSDQDQEEEDEAALSRSRRLTFPSRGHRKVWKSIISFKKNSLLVAQSIFNPDLPLLDEPFLSLFDRFEELSPP
jgi:hypothetical protein